MCSKGEETVIQEVPCEGGVPAVLLPYLSGVLVADSLMSFVTTGREGGATADSIHHGADSHTTFPSGRVHPAGWLPTSEEGSRRPSLIYQAIWPRCSTVPCPFHWVCTKHGHWELIVVQSHQVLHVKQQVWGL